MTKTTELIERLRSFEQDHKPDGWPAIKMRDVSALLNALEAQAREIEKALHLLNRWKLNGGVKPGYEFIDQAIEILSKAQTSESAVASNKTETTDLLDQLCFLRAAYDVIDYERSQALAAAEPLDSTAAAAAFAKYEQLDEIAKSLKGILQGLISPVKDIDEAFEILKGAQS